LSKIDAVDTSVANTTCKDVLNGKRGKDICIVASVTRVANHKIKKKGSKQFGKLMSFLTIEDSTCSLDSVVVFPDAREKYQYILYEGNNLMLCGEVENGNSFVVDKIHEI
jgi:DNA polymerase III alpha subunit